MLEVYIMPRVFELLYWIFDHIRCKMSKVLHWKPILVKVFHPVIIYACPFMTWFMLEFVRPRVLLNNLCPFVFPLNREHDRDEKQSGNPSEWAIPVLVNDLCSLVWWEFNCYIIYPFSFIVYRRDFGLYLLVIRMNKRDRVGFDDCRFWETFCTVSSFLSSFRSS